MRYILNVPRIPQQEFASATTVADTLVAMKRAINPALVTDRIMQLGEADVLSFGDITVIAIGNEAPNVMVLDATPQDITQTHIVKTQTIPPRDDPIERAVELDQAVPQPMTTNNVGRPKGK